MLQTGGGEVGVKRGAVVPSYFVAERRVLRFLDCFHPSSALFREQTRAAWPGLPKRARDACGIGVPVPPSLPAPSCAPAAAGDRLLEPCTRCRGAAAAPAALSLPCPPPPEKRCSIGPLCLSPSWRPPSGPTQGHFGKSLWQEDRRRPTLQVSGQRGLVVIFWLINMLQTDCNSALTPVAPLIASVAASRLGGEVTSYFAAESSFCFYFQILPSEGASIAAVPYWGIAQHPCGTPHRLS